MKDVAAPELPPMVYSEWRFSTLWMVGSLFVFGMCATYLLVTTTGPIRLPTAVAAFLAPWVSHLVLTPHAQQR